MVRANAAVVGPTGRESAGRQHLDVAEHVRVLLLIGVWKVATFGAIILVVLYLPANDILRQANLHYDTDSKLIGTLASWDASHYLYLADEGYKPDQQSNAFSPLLPLAIRGLNLVTGQRVLAGLLIVNAASGLGLYAFYLFARTQWGSAVAVKALVLLMAFPTAFFLNMIYSEGPFLFFAALFLWALYRGQVGLAAASAFFLPLTRLIGLVVIVPFAVYLLEYRGLSPLEFFRRDGRPFRAAALWEVPLLAAPVLGALTSFAYMHETTGDWLAAPHAAATFVSAWELENVWDPVKIWRIFWTPDLTFHGYIVSAVDRGFFIWFLASLPLAFLKLDKTLFVFCLVMGLQPLLGSWMSYTRYVLLAIPLFIAYARLFESGRVGRWAFYAVVPPLLAAQAYCLSVWASNDWLA